MNKPVKTIFALIFIIILNIGSLSFAHAASANVLVNLTNASRGQNGLANVTVNDKLTAAAFAKTNDMFANGYFAHTSPAGKTPWDFIKAVGYDYTYAGENLAIGYESDQELHDAWMASATHRANIMNGNFREIGIAVVTGDYEGAQTTIVVQMFGTQAAAVVEAPATPAPAENAPQVESATAAKSFTLDQTKTNFSPSQIFAGEKVKFNVVLTGKVTAILVTAGEQKIDLMEAATIQKDGETTTYTKEVMIEKSGNWPVGLSVTGEAGSETLNMGTLNIAEKTLSKEISPTVGQNIKDFAHQYRVTLIIIFALIVFVLAGILIYRFYHSWPKKVSLKFN